MSIPATFVSRVRGPGGEQAGAIEIRELDGIVHGFAFRCPCGCGQQSWLPIHYAASGEPKHSFEWDWDGDRERPTLSPSVLQSGLPCKWHGWLRGGEWVSC